MRYGAGVKAIEGEKGSFRLTLESYEVVEAETIILGIGVQGNPRRLGAPGDDAEFVQYQLDDPDEYKGESIVVVGAGDAAIENAVALAKNNSVAIVNRRDEFARAKDGNIALILAAIEAGDVTCFYGTNVARVDTGDFNGAPGQLVLSTPNGEVPVPVHRIIARLGAVPQRGLVEAFGVEFPSKDANALPNLSSQYECNVPGMYIIGALGGYPLIKQAMNQGYGVVEYILGNKIGPRITCWKKSSRRPDEDVDGILAMMQTRIPVFMGNAHVREVMLDSSVHAPTEKDGRLREKRLHQHLLYGPRWRSAD